jgi:hypothetical protein
VLGDEEDTKILRAMLAGILVNCYTYKLYDNNFITYTIEKTLEAPNIFEARTMVQKYVDLVYDQSMDPHYVIVDEKANNECQLDFNNSEDQQFEKTLSY